MVQVISATKKWSSSKRLQEPKIPTRSEKNYIIPRFEEKNSDVYQMPEKCKEKMFGMSMTNILCKRAESSCFTTGRSSDVFANNDGPLPKKSKNWSTPRVLLTFSISSSIILQRSQADTRQKCHKIPISLAKHTNSNVCPIWKYKCVTRITPDLKLTDVFSMKTWPSDNS